MPGEEERKSIWSKCRQDYYFFCQKSWYNEIPSIQEEKRWTKSGLWCSFFSTLLKVSGSFSADLALELQRDVVCKLFALLCFVKKTYPPFQTHIHVPVQERVDQELTEGGLAGILSTTHHHHRIYMHMYTSFTSCHSRSKNCQHHTYTCIQGLKCALLYRSSGNFHL